MIAVWLWSSPTAGTPNTATGPGRRTAPLLAVIAIALVAAGCSEGVPELTTNQVIDQTRSQLVAGGVDDAVADCVIRLAEHDLRLGPLDDVTQDELVLNCERAVSVLDREDSGSDESGRSLAFVDGPNTLGDDPELDRLWRACEDGLGMACDQLFDRSPVGSDYEQFGVSCGHRDEVLDCSELDEPDDG